jgi:hypothetical protein
MSVCCECCVMSGRGLCDGLITRPVGSYRLWRVVVYDQKTSKNEEAKTRYQAVKIQSQWFVTPGKQTNYIHAEKISITLYIVWTATIVAKQKIRKFLKYDVRNLRLHKRTGKYTVFSYV